jgi:monofunctional biosynthetic peptidoglycan transglycosylase
VFKRIFFTGFFLCLVGLGPLCWYLLNLPNAKALKTDNPTTSAIRIFREEETTKKKRKPHSLMVWRDLNEISPDLLHAVVLAEDDTFFQHNGFDIEMLKQAVRVNWKRKRFAFGASTITQQLARTLYLSSHKNLLRKAKEALITRQLERTLSKNRILELYVNVVEWGPQVYGAEAAARFWFQKSASELTPDEAIALAVILPNPRKWSPVKQTWFMAQRRAALYDRMIRAHYLEAPVSAEPGVPLENDYFFPPRDIQSSDVIN